MDHPKDCNCTSSSPDPLCKHHAKDIVEDKFMSNGVTYERIRPAIEREEKTKPRLFQPRQVMSEPDDYDDDDISPLPLMGRSAQRPNYRNARMVDNTAMLEMNRRSLRKFESLTINGKSLTEMAIGGFNVDYETAAAKAIEVIPLPQSKLPIIFIDEELNFYHHFFEGMKYVVGEALLEGIVEHPEAYDELSPVILPIVEKLVETSFERTDTELVLFLRKVFPTTFEVIGRSRRNRSEEEIVVASNIWGFQYIEPGMKMSEADLKMWLSMCHNHYKTIWFNTFKSTGVPEFARNMRSRSNVSTTSSSSLDSVREMSRSKSQNTSSMNEAFTDNDDTVSVRTRRSHHRKRSNRNDSLARFLRS